MNDAIQICFLAHLSGPQVNSTNDLCVCLVESGNLTIIARAGAPISAQQPSFVFADWFAAPSLRGNGEVFVRTAAGVQGEPESFTETIAKLENGNATLIAREGDAAPGTSTDVTFGKVFGGDVFSDPVLNQNGNAVFFGRLVGPGVDDFNNSGVWTYDDTNGLRLVVRTGQTVDLDETVAEDLRTIRHIGVFNGTGGEDGRESILNDSSQLVGCLEFLDGSTAIMQVDVSASILSCDFPFKPGDPVPMQGSFDPFIDTPTIDGSGKVVLETRVALPSGIQTGIFEFSGNDIETIAFNGEMAPTQNGSLLYDAFSEPFIGDEGSIFFEAVVEQSGNDFETLFKQSNGQVVEIGRATEPCPFVPGSVYSSFSAFEDRLAISSSGQLGLFARIDGSTLSDHLLLAERSGELTMLIREGDPIPQYGDGITLEITGSQQTSTLVVNNQNQSAFVGRIQGPGVFSGNRNVLFCESNGEVVGLFRQDESAPEFDAIAEWDSFANLRLNNNGDLLFIGKTSIPGNFLDESVCIYNEQTGLRLIAREGQQLDDNCFLSTTDFVSFNDNGQCVFYANVFDAGATVTGSGIFFFDGQICIPLQ